MTQDNNLIEKLKDWQSFHDELFKESDRACVILGAAYLDESIGILLANFFIDDPKVVKNLISADVLNAPLSTFASRITAAYCLGLIDKIQYNDLNTIRKIRNLFAHGLQGISFEDGRVIKECEKLKSHLTMSAPKTNDIKSIFLLSIVFLATDIAVYAKETLGSRRTSPDYYGVKIISRTDES
jgi:mannitol operon repressor